jgi:hypothetical protein
MVEGESKRLLMTNFLNGGLVRHIPVIEDYPYARVNFLRDPDMPMPPGEERGEIDKHIFLIYLIFIFFNIILFMLMSKYKLKDMLYIDVGPVRLTEFARTRCHPRPEVGPSEVGGPVVAGGPPA